MISTVSGGGSAHPTATYEYAQLSDPAQAALVAWYRQGVEAEVDEQAAVGLAKTQRYWTFEEPTAQFIIRLMADSDALADFATFEEYHRWYLRRFEVPVYPSSGRWPVLIPGADYLIEDGFHRFHAYVASGHLTIPLIEIV